MAMTLSNDLSELLALYPDDIQDMYIKCRNLIYTEYDAVEVVWLKMGLVGYGVGPNKNTEHFSWLKPNKKHITFGFNEGSFLLDPSGLLEGTGKVYRHVKIKHIQDISNPDLLKLLKEAIKRRC